MAPLQRHARIGLAVWVVVVALLTLSPNPGRGHHRLNVRPGFTPAYGRREVALGFFLNVLLFVPFGALARAAGLGLRRWWQVLAVAALLSVSIETAQWFAATGRAADVNDVIANTAGGVVGYLVAGTIADGVTPPEPGPQRPTPGPGTGSGLRAGRSRR